MGAAPVAELDVVVREGTDDFDFHTLFRSSIRLLRSRAVGVLLRRPQGCGLLRRATRCGGGRRARCMRKLFDCLTAWLAPILCFTAEEAWLVAQFRADGLRCICASIRRSRPVGATTRWPPSGRRSANCGVW